MKWDKYTIETTTAAEDIISAMLAGLGIEGVEIENNVPLTEEEAGGMFIDFPLELPPDDGLSKVSFYLEPGTGQEAILSKVHAALEEERAFMDIGPGNITKGQTQDVDWINNWKQFFQSFTIGNILIKPTWEELKEEDAGRILIEIDPGISFGTGKHETTQLCISQLQEYIGEGAGKKLPSGISSPKVLDVGCGSGILSIVALKLGAGSVTGIDIDENCIVSTRENMQANHIGEASFRLYAGNLIGDGKLQDKVGRGEYDIAAANILADVIIPMAPIIYQCLKEGGIFISSGIIDFKEEAVTKALSMAGFTVLKAAHKGEWVGITAVKEGGAPCTSFL